MAAAWCVQPILAFAWLKAFAAEFGRALNTADEVFVLGVYGAREQPLAGVSGASVARHVTVPITLRSPAFLRSHSKWPPPRIGRRHRHDGCQRRDLTGRKSDRPRVRSRPAPPAVRGCWDDGTQRTHRSRRVADAADEEAVTNRWPPNRKVNRPSTQNSEGPRRRPPQACAERAARRLELPRSSRLAARQTAVRRRIVSRQNPRQTGRPRCSRAEAARDGRAGRRRDQAWARAVLPRRRCRPADRDHRDRGGEPRGGSRRRQSAAGNAVAADRRNRFADQWPRSGGWPVRGIAAAVPVGLADHHRRAGPSGDQSFQRPAPFCATASTATDPPPPRCLISMWTIGPSDPTTKAALQC